MTIVLVLISPFKTSLVRSQASMDIARSGLVETQRLLKIGLGERNTSKSMDNQELGIETLKLGAS
jgi:hypothetical protein